MTPLLFLDIDGVLNTPASCSIHRSNESFLPTAVAALLKIQTETGCEVVISSSWRMEDQHRQIAPAFEKNGLGAILPHIVGSTPALSVVEGATREDEIEAWLMEHQQLGSFAILDDDRSEFRGELRSRLVLVDDNVGLTAADADKCIQMLRSKKLR